MEYQYIFSYNVEKNIFFGMVMSAAGQTVFQIDDTSDMRDLIESGDMHHIDDVVGLEEMLKHGRLLELDDKLVFGGIV